MTHFIPMTRKQRRKVQKRAQMRTRKLIALLRKYERMPYRYEISAQFVDHAAGHDETVVQGMRAIPNPDYVDATPVVFAWGLLRDQQTINVESVHGVLPPDYKFIIPIFYRREVTE